jgi:hypothetical protein
MTVAVGGGTSVGGGVLVAMATVTVAAAVAAIPACLPPKFWVQEAKASKKAAAAITAVVNLPVDGKG